MTFLQPALLFPLAAAVAIPAVIHWLSRRYPKKFPFSSIDDLRRSSTGRSRLLKWRHLLLIALRTLALAALLTAFLLPVTGLRDGAAAESGRHVVLVVDHSLSMTAAEQGASARQRAIGEVRRLLDSLGPRDRFQVILAGRTPRAAFAEFSNHRRAAIEFLEQAPPPAATADLHSACALVASLAGDLEGPLDVVFFSDFQRRNWADASFDRLPADTRLVFVPTAADRQRPNRAVLRVEAGPAAPVAGAAFDFDVRLANHAPDAWQGKVEARFLDGPTTEAEVALPAWGETTRTLRLEVPGAGLQLLEIALPGDDLPDDNQRRLVVRAGDREEVVLLTPEAADPAAPKPALFLATAVNPYGAGRGAYRPRLLHPDDLDGVALGGASRLIASGLPELPPSACDVLAGFLRGGGGMVWFLDGPAAAYNLARLSEALALEAPLRIVAPYPSTEMPDGVLRLARGDFDSRFLRLFHGERRQNLAQLEFYSVLRAAHESEGQVILSFADGTPAMVEVQAGLGTLLLCNFSVAEERSNLARQRLFPAWTHELLRRLETSTPGAGDRFLPGDPLHAEAWTAEVAGRDLLGPEGEAVRVHTSLRGERTSLSFTPDRIGFYRLPGGDGAPRIAFAVNADPEESDLRSLDPEVLPDRAGGQGNDDATAVAPLADFAELLRGKPAFHLFVLTALALLVGESLLLRFTTPRTS